MADRESVVIPGSRCGLEVVTPERWKQIEAVFEQALELPAGERPAFFEKTCNGDEDLRREVESLLVSHAHAGEFIDRRSLFFSHEILEQDAPSVKTGQLIGPYRVAREIGRGGMGAVYLAERADQQYQKQVAIKLIKRGMDTDAVLRHFRNERQILASFDHPNIARLFDAGTTESGLPYFVMEFVEGLPIDKYCDAHGLAITERLKLFREVCAAVIYAHRHAVIHRDIKPSNILVTNEGRPKLLDFGIAKILQPGNSAEALMTATGVRPMTPDYASPEQVAGKPLTTASDVYSLGVVLFELLTRCHPYRFETRSPEQIARVITEQEPTKPSTAVARSDGSPKSQIPNPKLLRGDLDNIVLMALRKEPERRYASVEQLSEDIRRHLEALPVRARKDTLGYRAAKFVSRNRALTGAATLVLVSLIGGLFATTWEAQRARAEKLRAERRFNDVRHLAHSVLFDYHDAIKDLPGATRARERLVKDALTYLDSLAHEAGGDPELQRELAAAYERVGDVRGQAYSASLGDRTGALESYEKSLRIRKTLLAVDSHNAQSRRDVAAINRKIGTNLLQTTEASRGLDQLREALAIVSKLVDENPTDVDARSELANIYNDMGGAFENRGEMPASLEHNRKAIALREELARTDPSNAKARRDLSVSYVNTGRALYLSGDFAGAIAINSKALELRQNLLAQDSTNADYRRLLAIAHQNDGDYRAQIGDIAAALESFRKKLLLDEQSLAADPANIQARDDYAYSCERLGALAAQLGHREEALSHFEHNLAVREKIVAEDPQNLEAGYRLAGAEAEVALTCAQLGRRERALEQCRRSFAQLESMPFDPTNVYFSAIRADAYTYLGDSSSVLAKNKDDWHTARTMYERSLQIWNDLRDRKLLRADDAAKPEETTRAIAKVDSALAGQ